MLAVNVTNIPQTQSFFHSLQLQSGIQFLISLNFRAHILPLKSRFLVVDFLYIWGKIRENGFERPNLDPPAHFWLHFDNFWLNWVKMSPWYRHGFRHGSLSAEKLISDFFDQLINEILLFLSIFFTTFWYFRFFSCPPESCQF